VREELTELLRDEGHEVEASADGAVAMAWLERARVLPAVILLDLVMPAMNGWEFRKRQRHHERLSGVPVVVMSGAGDVKSEALGLDADGVLLKPFDAVAVAEAIAPFLTAR
jgi:CheY-like chemotaxis protein